MELNLAGEAATTCAGAALARGLPDLADHSLLFTLSGERGSVLPSYSSTKAPDAAFDVYSA